MWYCYVYSNRCAWSGIRWEMNRCRLSSAGGSGSRESFDRLSRLAHPLLVIMFGRRLWSWYMPYGLFYCYQCVSTLWVEAGICIG
jgi:hypothetical protein